MADLSTIQDYSMIDGFLQDSLKNYSKQLFGDYDENTGYFQTQQNEVEDELEQEAQLEDEQTESYANDPVNEDESMYDYLFGDGSYQQSSQSTEEDDTFAPDTMSEAEEEGTASSTSWPIDDRGKKSLKNQISDKESEGKYTAINPNSSATGKYQFMWSDWGDSIKKVTGVKDQKAFLNNPKAQEKYYDFYEKKYLLPQVEKIKREIKTNLTTDQLAKLVHFRGEAGARKYLKGEAKDKPESYNMPTSEYIKQAGGIIPNPSPPIDIYGVDTAEQSLRAAKKLKVDKDGDFKGLIPIEDWTDDMMNYVEKIKFVTKKGERFIKVRGSLRKYEVTPGIIPTEPMNTDVMLQGGGTPIAKTRRQQYVGLNNSDIDSLILPLDGVNTIRGLDSGEPVFVNDSVGKKRILRGNKDTVRMKGRVFERKL